MVSGETRWGDKVAAHSAGQQNSRTARQSAPGRSSVGTRGSRACHSRAGVRRCLMHRAGPVRVKNMVATFLSDNNSDRMG